MPITTNERAREHIGHKLLMSRRWDAAWCLDCREWAEPKCSDPQCEYCTERPVEPKLSIE